MTDANDAAKRLREDIRQGCVGGQIAEDWLAVLDSLEAAEKELSYIKSDVIDRDRIDLARQLRDACQERDALREEVESARRRIRELEGARNG